MIVIPEHTRQRRYLLLQLVLQLVLQFLVFSGCLFQGGGTGKYG
jgi:hypothetical protein